MLNILYHHRTQGTGAEGVHITGIINGFRSLGHNVCVVSPPGVDPERTAGGNPYSKKTNGVSRVLHYISRLTPQFLFEILETLYNIRAHYKISNVIAKNKIDFIYERHSFFAFAVVRLAKKYNIPIIVEVNELAGEKRIRKQVFVGIAKRCENCVFKNADAIIVVSDFLKNKIEECGIDESKIKVMPNAVDHRKFVPKGLRDRLRDKYGVNSAGVVMGFIGWFVYWHNIELLIDVFSEITKEKNTYLCLVGDGVLKNKFKAMIKDRGIEGRVIFPGAVSYDNMPDYIDMMDICVIPDSNEYRSPIKMFEYMAMAKPVVAPMVPPIETVIKNGENGVLFASKNRNDFKNVLNNLLENEDKRERLGLAAKDTILRNHTWHKNAEQILNIASKIMKNTSQPLAI
jgi:glycosyltransferase involved in cell wall biosynthesis